jgi:hypothetical protein
MGNPLEIVTKFSSDVSGLKKGAEEAKGAIGGISPAALLTGTAVVGMAAVAVGAIVDLTVKASELQAQQELVNKAYENATGVTGDYSAAINEAKDAGVAKGFTDEQTLAALTPLISATHDAAKANEDLKTAQDIARFAGVDLATAADAVAKASAGQATQLTRLLPGLEKGKTATETLANAQKLAAGASDTYASSTKGQMDVASASFSQLGDTIGTAFLPVLAALMPPLIQIIKLIGQLITAILPPLEVIIGVLVTITGKLVDVWVLEFQILGQLVTIIANRLAPILHALAPVFDAVAKAIGGVVDWLRQLLDWIGRAIDAVGNLLGNLNPLKGFSLPSLPFSVAAASSSGGPSASTRSGDTGGALAGGTVIVNVYGGDPRRVTEAVKQGYRRWIETEGRSAITREW